MKCQARTHPHKGIAPIENTEARSCAQNNCVVDHLRAFRVHEHLSRGLALHLQGKPRAALNEYRQALDLDATDAYGRYLAGLTLKAMGCDREARKEWFVAKALRPRDEDCAWGIAMAKKLLDSNY